MSIIEDYWAAGVARLRAEVDGFARSVKHVGEMGREHETSLGRLLKDFLPLQYGLGTGEIIDTEDNRSQQTDIVIFDQFTQPRIFSQTTQLLFPVETVYAGIEVKALMRAADIEDIKQKVRSLKSLKIDRELVHTSCGLQLIDPPYFFVFAYDTDVAARTIVQRFAEAERDQQPDILLVLKKGLLAGKDGYPLGYPGVRGPFSGALAFRHWRDETTGALVSYGAEWMRGNDPDPGKLDTSVYIEEQQAYVVTEPARALLIFLSDITWRLAAKPLARGTVMHRYLQNDRFSELYDLTGRPAKDSIRAVQEPDPNTSAD